MEPTIHVVDAVLGAGKTSAAINYINAADESRHFIYVTPYLAEAQRIIDGCPTKKFYAPSNFSDNDGQRKASKLISLKWLLDHQKNIATTHALFQHFDDEVKDLCQTYKYELIMDEVSDVVDAYKISKSDMQILLDNWVDVSPEDGTLSWRPGKEDYVGKFSPEKRLINMKCLAMYGTSMMLWLFPVSVFEAFRQTFILTYMFESQLQCYYYKFYKKEYDYLSVAGDNVHNFHFTKDKCETRRIYDYRNLVTIIDDPKLNEIGDPYFALSSNWYQTNKSNSSFEIVRKNMTNFFRNKKTVLTEGGHWRKCKSTEALWTVFKQDPTDKNCKDSNSAFAKRISKGSGVSKSFEACTARSVNKWADRKVVAYLVNRFIQPGIKNFFETNNINVDEDGYALSEMLQFIWRSAIRRGEHITVYIPSKRMRNLLIQWIDENSTD